MLQFLHNNRTILQALAGVIITLAAIYMGVTGNIKRLS